MKTIGKYQVADEIGRSAAGVTCRARDPFRNRDFALKILSPLAALSAPSKEQLYRDLATSWDLSHRHIAKVYDIGELEGGVYIATELLTGIPLQTLLSAQSLPIAEQLALMAQVCEALACAHSKGIAHGNVKPGNILVSDERNTSLLDFGTGTWQTLLLASGVRLNGLVPNYLAPEQVLGQPFDHRSDVFSVGVILYEMLRGQHPFQAPPGLVSREIVHSEPEPLRKWMANIPGELEEIVLRSLKKDPRERVQTTDELAANLYVIAQHLRRETPAAPPGLAALERQTASPSEPPVVPEEQAVAAGPPAGSEPVLAASNIPAPEPLPESTPSVEPVPAATAFAMPSVDAVPLRPSAPAQPAVPPQAPPAPPIQATAVPAPPLPIPAQLSVPVARPQPRPLPSAKPPMTGRRIATFATGAVMALAMVGVIVVRQNQGAQASHNAAPQAVAARPSTAAPSVVQDQKPSPVPAATAHESQPAAPEAPAQPPPAPEQILRGVRPLWEAGQYAQAMRLVDEVLADSPANSDARTWKKRIRAAQDAEAAMK